MAEMNFIKSQVNIEQLVGSGDVNIGEHYYFRYSSKTYVYAERISCIIACQLLIQPVSKFESTASIAYAVTQIKRNWSSTETDKLIVLFLQKFLFTKTVRVSTLHITYS